MTQALGEAGRRPIWSHVRSHSLFPCQYRMHQVSPFSRASTPIPPTEASLRYWGKRDEKLILPTNSSLSVTLDQDHLRSTTTSRTDPSFSGADRLWLNGKEEVIKEKGRMWTCIRELRTWRREMEEKDPNLPKVCCALDSSLISCSRAAVKHDTPDSIIQQLPHRCGSCFLRLGSRGPRLVRCCPLFASPITV